MDLSRYLKIGLRWWWLMLLSVVLSATASYFYSQQLPKIYAAKVTMMVGASVVETLNPNERTLGLSRTLAEVYAQLVPRKVVTQGVIDRLGLEMVSEQLGAMIQTNVIPSAQLLEITVLDIHPQRAQLLANALADELILQSPTGSLEQQNREEFIQAQLAELQNKINETDNAISELEDSMVDLTSAVEIAEAQAKLGELEELQRDYQDSYTQFLASLSDTSPNKLTVFESASLPTQPVSPNVRLNVLMAAVAGLALAVSAIVFLEFFDDTLVWQPEESRSLLGLPILGAINKVANSAGKIVARDNMWSAEANALRNLRSSLFLAAKREGLKTLLVTSPSLGEGKSFLAINLAAIVAAPGSSMAAVIATPGARVILVDTDLRKPSLHEIFDMPNLIGLADVLAAPETIIAEATLSNAIRPTGIDNLFLLPAGRTPMDPGYLLNSSLFPEVLELLRAQADLVILDSAPLLAATETAFVADAVDGTVLVVSEGQTRRRALQRAIEYTQVRDDSNLLGVVFNRVSFSGTTYNAYHNQAPLPRIDRTSDSDSLLGWLWPFGDKKKQQAEIDMLGASEVADYFGVSKETVHRWCAEGRLVGVKQGRQWQISLENMNEFIAAYQNGGYPDRSKSELGSPETEYREELSVPDH